MHDWLNLSCKLILPRKLLITENIKLLHYHTHVQRYTIVIYGSLVVSKCFISKCIMIFIKLFPLYFQHRTNMHRHAKRNICTLFVTILGLSLLVFCTNLTLLTSDQEDAYDSNICPKYPRNLGNFFSFCGSIILYWIDK